MQPNQNIPPVSPDPVPPVQPQPQPLSQTQAAPVATVPEVVTAVAAPVVNAPLPTSLPGYQEIINQILQELNKRKGILFLRVVLTLIPFLVGLVLLYASASMPSQETGESGVTSLSDAQMIMTIIAGTLLVIVGPIWAIITGRIFKTERLIWIDSFFDKVALSNSESWSIARKLFWPSVWLELSLFFRYYFVAILAFVLIEIAGIVLLIQLEGEVRGWLLLIIAIVPLIGLIVYTYYMQLKLRYAWFIFIDMYGSAEYSHTALYRQMKELNNRLKQEDFKKLMATTIGLDVVGAGANMALNGFTAVLSRFGSVGKLIADIISLVGGSMIAVSKDYAKQVSYYMFYKLALQSLHGQNYKQSTSLYSQNSL